MNSTAMKGTTDMTKRDVRIAHPEDTGPGYKDEDGQPARIVQCPECGQMEWWTESECQDHGQCRARPAVCPVCAST